MKKFTMIFLSLFIVAVIVLIAFALLAIVTYNDRAEIFCEERNMIFELRDRAFRQATYFCIWIADDVFKEVEIKMAGGDWGFLS